MPAPSTWEEPPAAWADAPAAHMGRLYGEAGLREYLRCYAAQITMMNAWFGRILATLDELKPADRTLVIFTTDHGNLLGRHGMMDKTVSTFYDDLTHVPLPMRLPGALPAGKTCGAFARTVDIAPAILDLLGASPLTATQGHSLRALVAGQDAGPVAVFANGASQVTGCCADDSDTAVEAQPAGQGCTRIV